MHGSCGSLHLIVKYHRAWSIIWFVNNLSHDSFAVCCGRYGGWRLINRSSTMHGTGAAMASPMSQISEDDERPSALLSSSPSHSRLSYAAIKFVCCFVDDTCSDTAAATMKRCMSLWTRTSGLQSISLRWLLAMAKHTYCNTGRYCCANIIQCIYM